MRVMLALLLLTLAGPGMSAQPMDGAWTVDLSPKADGSYTKPMQLELKADGTVAGNFYQSAIQAGRWKADRGRTCVSFRTSDGAGPYQTSACLVGDAIQGQTWADHRNFVFNWNAVRTK